MSRRLPLVVAITLVAGGLGAVAVRTVGSRGAKPAADTRAALDAAPAPDPTVAAGPPPTTTPQITVTTPEPSAAAQDPKGLAGQIVSAQKAIADPATTPAGLYRNAHLQQVAFRRIVAQPELKDATLAELPAALRPMADANIVAGTKLRAMTRRLKDTLPQWRIVAPAPAEELLGYYREASAATGIDWQYLAAINLVETRMGRIRGNSVAGAQGPMQFMPATWAAYGSGDINSDHDSIVAAARYLQRNGAPNDMRAALWNYNHDYRYVDAVTLYAKRMQADPRAFYAYHQWQVYYLTVNGDVWLPEGFEGSG